MMHLTIGDLGVFKDGVSELTPDDPCAKEDSVAEVGLAEVRLDEIHTVKDGPAEVGPAEVGPAESGPVELGLPEVGPAQIGPAQIGPAQVGPAEDGPTEVAVFQGWGFLTAQSSSIPLLDSTRFEQRERFVPIHVL